MSRDSKNNRKTPQLDPSGRRNIESGGILPQHTTHLSQRIHHAHPCNYSAASLSPTTLAENRRERERKLGILSYCFMYGSSKLTLCSICERHQMAANSLCVETLTTGETSQRLRHVSCAMRYSRHRNGASSCLGFLLSMFPKKEQHVNVLSLYCIMNTSLQRLQC